MLANVYLIQGKHGPFSSKKSEEKTEITQSFPIGLGWDYLSVAVVDGPFLRDKAQRWNNYPIPKRISGLAVAGKGPTNATSYSGLQAFFAPQYPLYTVLPFLEATGLYFLDDSYGVNIGVGGRYLPTQFPVIFGFNTTGSYYQAKLGPLFQLGLGLEMIAKRWGLYANGYIPVGRKRNVSKKVFDEYGDGFKASCTQTQSSYIGFNMEGSLLALQRGDFFLYASGGPYFFSSHQSCSPISFWGGQFTIQPQYNDWMSLSFSVSHDPFQGTLIQGQIVLSLPLYAFSRLKGYRGYRDHGWINRQIYQPLQRFGPVPLDTTCGWKANF